mgnify:CR=1 FL=1
MSEEACNVKFKEDLNPACEASLRKIASNLGPHGRQLLARRIVVSNPKVRKTLRWIGLSEEEEST